MRVIEREMISALSQGRNWRKSNTEVIITERGKFVRLYNTIIYALVNGKEYFSDGGWSTVTTGSRLRALGARYSTNDRLNECELTPRAEMERLYFNY